MGVTGQKLRLDREDIEPITALTFITPKENRRNCVHSKVQTSTSALPIRSLIASTSCDLLHATKDHGPQVILQ